MSHFGATLYVCVCVRADSDSAYEDLSAHGCSSSTTDRSKHAFLIMTTNLNKDHKRVSHYRIVNKSD